MRKLKNEELGRLSVEEYKAEKKRPIVIVLDNVRSMHNVGSAFRTADAFLVEKVYLCGITAKPPHREINKTALGATESVAWAHREKTMEVVEQLKEDGYKIICVEQADESVPLQDFMPYHDCKYCIVFGNEVFGVEDEVVAAADTCLEIPQFGTKHSLNISVSIGIVMWDFFKKLED
uniref:RNA methyltransferase n=1 Tax=Roseihalotalea indica TaxID=2867963 RepID=A0AA49JHS7_9BACT|nr:RNA methyltransferase [Tunicatimonas sp. TK19036]